MCYYVFIIKKKKKTHVPKKKKNSEHNDKFIFDRKKVTFFSFLSGAERSTDASGCVDVVPSDASLLSVRN